MQTANTALQTACDLLAELDVSDREAVIGVGVALEGGLNGPGGLLADELVTGALEGLQAVYACVAANPPAVAAGAAACVALALATAEGKPLKTEAAAQALAAVRRAVNEAPVAEETPATREPLTLDAVAAELIQLDPGDTAAMECLAEALQTQGDARLDEAARLLREAAGGSLDPDHALAMAGDRLSELMDASEDACRVRPDSPPQAQAEVTAAAPDPASDVAPAATPDDQVPVRTAEGRSHYRMPETDPALLGEFVVESRENIESAEIGLLTLETDPSDTEAINTVFRAFHTIKGTSAFLSLELLTKLAHLAETMLSRARDGEICLQGGYADLALRSVDTIRDFIDAVDEAGDSGILNVPPTLAALMHDLQDPEATVGRPDDWTPAAPATPRTAEAEAFGSEWPEPTPEGTQPGEGDDEIEASRSDSGVGADPQSAKGSRAQDKAAGDANATVRVRTDRLDRLIEMTGELVIAQSMVAEDGAVVSGGRLDLGRKVARAGKIIRELQDITMSLRMVPLRGTFQKMARLVRDVARKCGKLVELSIEGEDTEIDRHMVDALGDPLVHMVRNAVDHGIEAPEDRERAGKSPAGRIRLVARHLAGNVLVELHDDGRGLDRDRIARKATERGVIASDKGMSDSEVFALILAPGFSTAETVTEFSGRGVGLDVVRRSIESLQGRVEITSDPGCGTCFTLRLPLTLAVTDGMLVRVAGQTYIIPTLSIEMTVRASAESLASVAGEGELLVLRGHSLPVFRLQEVFRLGQTGPREADGMLVIVSDADRRYALLVDELLGQQHVVAKPLGEGIARVAGVSGAAVLGDGSVGLILDPGGIAASARAL